MTKTTRWVIVGCGHMGLAIARGLLDSTPRYDIVVVEQSEDRRRTLAREFGLPSSVELEIEEHDLVVLAIPPQAFAEFARAERHKFAPATRIVSVMAGVVSESIGHALGTAEVVRAIPNTPAEVFVGMTVYYAGPSVSGETVAQTEELFGTIGRVLRVDAEHLVDDATAICGGGPAFVSYFVDAFCSFAASNGFTPAAGLEMAVQVFGGTARLIERSGKPPMQLCQEVMTPNGTTERGIAAFDAADLKSSIVAGLHASALRSRELGVGRSDASVGLGDGR